jgi:hypothetical protein
MLYDLKDRLTGKLPFFTSDELIHYSSILGEIYSSEVSFEPTGKPGRPRSPVKVLDPDLNYGTVKKTRVGYDVVKVDRNIIYGTEEAIRNCLENSPSNTINTAFIERSNINWRLWDSHLTRKSLCFAKCRSWFHAKLAICISAYNFIRPHSSLKVDCGMVKKEGNYSGNIC